MSLAVQALQIATVAAIEETLSGADIKVIDSMVDPRDLSKEAKPIVVVSAVQGRLNFKDKALFDAAQTVDLCLDFAIARQVTRTVEQPGVGEDDPPTEIAVDFPDNGAGHDFILRTLAYQVFTALQARNGTWADLWRELWRRGDEESPSTWERGVAADRGVRLGILRYTLKLELLDDPTPGALPAAGTTWDKLLTAMDGNPELADKAAFWRDLIASPALPDWRRVQAALGLSLTGIRGSAIAPLEGAEEPANEGEIVVATEIEGEDLDRDLVVAVDADGATLTEGEQTTPIVEVPQE